MLCPDVDDVMDHLAQSSSTITRVDAFAFASMNTSVATLPPDPDWLGPMRQELALLSAAGAQWQQQKPVLIWTPLLSQFSSYYALFSGVAAVQPDLGNDRDAWLKVLSSLSAALSTAASASRAAEAAFTLQVNNLNSVEQVFNTSLNKAGAALGAEEEKMMALASQVTALQDRLDGLQESLNAAEISAGKSYIQSSVTVAYTLVSSAGASIPYLSIAGLLFTVGKMAYDLIVTDKEIDATISQIVALRTRLNQEAQAAAMAKAIIHLINAFDKNLLAAGRQLPALSAMWAAENEKVVQAIHALQAGAVPQQMIDLVTIPSAAATWKSLNDFVARLLTVPAGGRPVTISTG